MKNNVVPFIWSFKLGCTYVWILTDQGDGNLLKVESEATALPYDGRKEITCIDTVRRNFWSHFLPPAVFHHSSRTTVSQLTTRWSPEPVIH